MVTGPAKSRVLLPIMSKAKADHKAKERNYAAKGDAPGVGSPRGRLPASPQQIPRHWVRHEATSPVLGRALGLGGPAAPSVSCNRGRRACKERCVPPPIQLPEDLRKERCVPPPIEVQQEEAFPHQWPAAVGGSPNHPWAAAARPVPIAAAKVRAEVASARTSTARGAATKMSLGRTVVGMQSMFALLQISLMLIVDTKLMVLMKYMDRPSAVNFFARTILGTCVLGTFVGPYFSQLADARGRKFLLNLGCAWSLFARTIDIIRPVPSTLMVTTISAPLYTIINQAALTSIGDIFRGDPKAAGGAIAGMQMGLAGASIVFPVIGARLAQINLRLPMIVALAVSVAMALLNKFVLPETLPEEKRAPVEVSKINPFGAFKVFLKGPRLACLALSYMMVEFLNPIMVGGSTKLVNMETLGWDIVQATQFMSLNNAAQIPGLAFGGRAIKRFGSGTGIFVGSLVTAVQHFLEAAWVKSSRQQFSLLPLLALRGLGKAGLEALIIEAGTEAEMGPAELRGSLEGLTKVAWMLCSPIWASLYGRCLQKPRRFYFGMAAVAVLQMLFGMLGAALPHRAKPTEKKEKKALPSSAMKTVHFQDEEKETKKENAFPPPAMSKPFLQDDNKQQRLRLNTRKSSKKLTTATTTEEQEKEEAPPAPARTLHFEYEQHQAQNEGRGSIAKPAKTEEEGEEIFAFPPRLLQHQHQHQPQEEYGAGRSKPTKTEQQHASGAPPSSTQTSSRTTTTTSRSEIDRRIGSLVRERIAKLEAASSPPRVPQQPSGTVPLRYGSGGAPPASTSATMSLVRARIAALSAGPNAATAASHPLKTENDGTRGTQSERTITRQSRTIF